MLVAISPLFISAAVLLLNFYRRYDAAQLAYFILYPVLSSLVYAGGMDVGIELFFILYGVLAVFYMRNRIYSLLAFLVSAACYLFVYVWTDPQQYSYQLRTASLPFFLFNHILALLFIFSALYWLKKENGGFQKKILANNRVLDRKRQEVEEQKDIIANKVDELSELNALKNKLFSIISHDLKNPLYALQNLFRQAEQYNLSGDDLKQMVPDILNDLNYTTALMENLLQWAKSQMEADALRIQKVDIAQLVNDTTRLLRLQAEAKQIYIETKLEAPVYVSADKDMLNLVLRNLLSNAIKFTPERGRITVETTELNDFVEVSVSDTGVGMNAETLAKLTGIHFYTTKGTSNETGTGLGLMLCRDFLKKLGSRMFIESEPGRGSAFSFTLQKQE
jgi:signal transduction histidine kinase